VAKWGLPVDEERLFKVLDALEAVAAETGKSIPQVAIAWLLTRPTVSSVILGARNEAQLKDNLGAVGWSLGAEQLQLLGRGQRRCPRRTPIIPTGRTGAFRRWTPGVS
jgi:aryl-alcohol dehydrogenase-like predicted oxidoreductase